ncbi:PKD-like family lipoprotein [Chitinophaga arvensicola]|uniref:PKD-like family protein n=1 Tax=Chitinophaga arvensicola TaxID=29529 RepID=A0A1I0SBU6_9BACT|nr:PKD-like family lipoprotein [Chitinophaga arvensicola]SEW54217.1 PKD-like family protein [Chitinophaga arvensicola]
MKFSVYNWLYILLLVAFIQSGCLKDNGNKAVTPINVLTITDTTAVAAVLQFDTLTVKPDIKQALPVDDGGLIFEWSIHQNDSEDAYPVYILDSTRYLHKSISVKPGIYRLIYKVTVKASGVTYFKFFDLKVINRFSEGWLVLEDIGGKTDLTVILKTDTLFHHVFTSLNKENTLDNPVQVATTNTYGDKQLFLFGANNAIELDYTQLTKLTDYTRWFWETPAVFRPQRFRQISTSVRFIINDGRLTARFSGGFPGEVKYLNTLPFPGGKADDYYFSSYAGVGPQPYTGEKTPYTAFFFDTKTKGFVYLSGASLIPSLAAFNAPTGSSLFDMRNIGLDLLAMDQGNASYLNNAIFKDGSNYYLYQIDANVSDPAVNKKLITGDAPQLAAFTRMTSSKKLQQIYFLSNGNIHLYDILSGKARVIQAIAAGEEVTYMQCTGDEVMVGTWNGTEGKLYRYTISPLGEFGGVKVFTGFGKIVSMNYKAA